MKSASVFIALIPASSVALADTISTEVHLDDGSYAVIKEFSGNFVSGDFLGCKPPAKLAMIFGLPNHGYTLGCWNQDSAGNWIIDVEGKRHVRPAGSENYRIFKGDPAPTGSASDKAS
jgi:hypothetical protein